MSTREEFLENEIRTLNHHIQSMIDTMKVMSMNKQDMSNEIERLKSEVENAQWVKTYSGGKPNYTQPDEALMKRVMDGIPDMPIKVQDEPYNPLENNFNYERGFIDGQQKQMESAVHRAVNAVKKEWVGLTDKEIEDCLEMSIYGTCRAIESKLKEKNT